MRTIYRYRYNKKSYIYIICNLVGVYFCVCVSVYCLYTCVCMYKYINIIIKYDKHVCIYIYIYIHVYVCINIYMCVSCVFVARHWLSEYNDNNT